MGFNARLLSLCLAFVVAYVPAPSHAANFAGVWTFNMTGTKDQCGLGMKGKKEVISNVVITQKGKKASLTLKGVKFAGKVNGNKISGSGSYNYSGIKISGSLNATLKSKTKLSIPNTKLTIKAGAKSCIVMFKGTGTKTG